MAGSMDMDICSDLILSSKATATATAAAAAEEKVCVLVGLNSDVGIFLLNLDQDQDLKGADANGFVDILPNLRVDIGFYFDVLEDTLYLFDNHTNDVAPEVYSIKLQAVSEMSNRTFGKEEVRSRTDFTKLSDCLGPKKLLKSLAYRDSILIFSSEINFHVYDDENEDKYEFEEYHNLKDFELYVPEGEGRMLHQLIYRRPTRVLPQFIVCRPRYSRANVFKLYDSVSKKYYGGEFTGSRPTFDSFSFSIVSFGVDVVEDKFIIETEFGKMFSLKLDGSDDYWRLCKQGYEFLKVSKNIVTSNGICFDAFGANDSRARWLKQRRKQQQEEREQSRKQKQEEREQSRKQLPKGREQLRKTVEEQLRKTLEEREEQEQCRKQQQEEQEQWRKKKQQQEQEQLGLLVQSDDEDGDGRKRASFVAPSHSHSQYRDGRSTRVGFPPTFTEIEECGLIFRYGHNSSAFDFLKLMGDPSCARICIVRPAFDYIGAHQECSSKLYLWLNVLEVNLYEFPGDKDYNKFVKQIRSFKFSVPERIYIPEPFVAGLFYY